MVASGFLCFLQTSESQNVHGSCQHVVSPCCGAIVIILRGFLLSGGVRQSTGAGLLTETVILRHLIHKVKTAEVASSFFSCRVHFYTSGENSFVLLKRRCEACSPPLFMRFHEKSDEGALERQEIGKLLEGQG